MKISEIKEQKNNKDRFSVSVDGKYAFSLSTNDLLDAKLAVDQEISESQIDVFRQKSADSLLLARTYEKCMRRPHSEREIRDYLRQKKAGEEAIEFIIGKCYDLRLLNDEDFAERWVAHRQKSNKSVRYIRNELFSKGIAQDIIESVLPEDDLAELRNVVAKRRGRYSDERKLIAYLQRQGFSYSDIKEVLTNQED